ncbi:MAG TPA: type 2 isopentenyl-diphosphate Delta-isomerase [Ktedonobacterales bacterium]|nr:type 2 isopentenyl-diphosphate Delta-isomerase [Ktedonobacterales bacterium]
MTDEVKQRKAEHVSVALARDVAVPQPSSWRDVRLIHQSLPEVDLDAVDTSVSFLGQTLRAPIFISSMTGGHPDVEVINARLAQAAEEFGLAMGVGSQRAGIVSPDLAGTYGVVRERAPNAFLIANIGAPQLIAQSRHPAFHVEDARRAVEMIGANALAVHMNFAQEAVQPEGDRRAVGCRAALRVLTEEIGLPVIAKETGAGVCREQALLLRDCGVAAIDVGGAGGSSMAVMETYRAISRGDDVAANLGQVFSDWGIPTPVAVVEAGAAGLPLIATGGVRTGLDAARALALGATLVGMAFPFLKAASESYEAVQTFVRQFLLELQVAMQLCGAPSIAALGQVDVIVGGETRQWLEMRGFGETLRAMANRRLGHTAL